MAVSSITFKGGEVPSTPTVEPASQKPQKLSLAEEAPKDSVSFCGKEHKKEVKCEKTHFFTILCASLGAASGVGAAVLSKGKGKLIAAGIGVGGALGGAVAGFFSDFVINKTVKNTTQSVIDNLD